MLEGRIIKGIAGFYYVDINNEIYECKARGKFRNTNITPLIGDYVIVEEDPSEGLKGNIVEILPRVNELIRPTVANVNKAVVVFAVSHPKPNLALLDRFLILVAEQNLDTTICFNKIDVESSNNYEYLKNFYKKVGYDVVISSALNNEGVLELKERLQNKTTVFAGPSGVGKSTLLNKIQPSLKLKTDEISSKVKRGKHTTRHAELLTLDFGGYVVDTPGFTSLYLNHINLQELDEFFMEFRPYYSSCKFNTCTHVHEPSCAVKAAVEQGLIHEERYNSYVSIYKELEQLKKW